MRAVKISFPYFGGVEEPQGGSQYEDHTLLEHFCECVVTKDQSCGVAVNST